MRIFAGSPVPFEKDGSFYETRAFAVLLPFLFTAGCVANSDEPEPRHAGFGIADGIEARTSGRLGYSLIASDGEQIENYRANERFAMCSTFKAALAGMALEADQKRIFSLDDRIVYGPADLLEYAPVTRANAARGYMTVAELAEAAVTVSDNTAANLLLAKLGGPEAFSETIKRWGRYRNAARPDRTDAQ